MSQEKSPVSVTLIELIGLLADYRGAHPVSFLLRTNQDGKQAKTANPFYGKVDKVERLSAWINVDYATAVRRAQKKEGVIVSLDAPDAFIVRPSYGIKVDDAYGDEIKVAPICQASIGIDDDSNTVALYLAFLPGETVTGDDGKPEKHYIWTCGPKREHRLTDAEVVDLRSRFRDADGKKAEASAQRSQGVSEIVPWIKVNVLSVLEARFSGTHYKVADFTLPKLAQEITDACVKDVEKRREIRRINDESNALAKRAKTAAIKAGQDERVAEEIGLRTRFTYRVQFKTLNPLHLEQEIAKGLAAYDRRNPTPVAPAVTEESKKPGYRDAEIKPGSDAAVPPYRTDKAGDKVEDE